MAFVHHPAYREGAEGTCVVCRCKVAVVVPGLLAALASISIAWGQTPGSAPAASTAPAATTAPAAPTAPTTSAVPTAPATPAVPSAPALAVAPTAAAVPNAGDFGAFVDDIVRRQVEELKVAGAVVIAVKDGQVLHKAAFGHANIAQGRSMDPEQTVVRLASISKLFTAIAVMQLAEQGRLDLDRDIQDYVDFPVPRESDERAITLRRLLTHEVPFEERVGGIGSFSGGRRDLRTFLVRHWPPRLDADPGVLSYTNFQFAVAAYVVERISGELFESYLEKHIFAPLGMQSTSARQPLPAPLASRVSEGYVTANLPPTPQSSGAAIIHEVGSTGVCASADDVARFMIALLENGAETSPPILSTESLRQMLSPQVATSGGVMGLAFSSPLADTDSFIGHAGGTGGFSSVLALSPSDRFGIFVLYNSMTASAPSASKHLLQQLSARYFLHRRPVEADGVPWWKPADVRGVYQPMRRNESTSYRLLSLLGQVRYTELPDGSLGSSAAIVPFLAADLRGKADVSFVSGARGLYARDGSPFSMYSRVPFWMRADLIVPVVLCCLLIAVARMVAGIVVQPRGWLPCIAYLGLFAQIAAIVSTMWLLIGGGDILVRTADPSVPRIAFTIYALAWLGVVGAAVRVWLVVRRWPEAGWLSRVVQSLLATVAVTLAAFSIFWKVAGTSLSF